MGKADSMRRDFSWYSMKLTEIALFASILVPGASVMADIQPIQAETDQYEVVVLANSIYSVTDLKLGEFAYRIVALDSKFNGDLTETTILLVNRGVVGGEAGYDVAFMLTPSDDAGSLRSARIEHGEIALTLIDRKGGTIKKFVQYDPISKTLKERLGKILPYHLPSGDSGATVTGPASGQDDESGVKNAVAQCTEIIKTKIIPPYEIKDGFSVKPQDIKYEDDPAIAKWLDEYGSIWKRLNPVVADAYAGIQRKVNERYKPEANKYRALLADTFNQALALRGGGSESVKLYTFAPAHEEWIIAHFGTSKSDNVPDEEFVSRLMEQLTPTGVTVGTFPERHEVQSVLAKLKAVERFLNKDDAAFLRAEFLSYL
jgi:hypothetical protein